MSVDNKEEVEEGNGVLFWVNKGGFPIDEATWERMYNHVTKIHPDGYRLITRIRTGLDLPQIPVPQAPLNFQPIMSIPDRLKKIQSYMDELQYNHTGTQFFEIRKNRPLSGLMESAKEMIREALPIKCLEAVILGIFLTNGMLGVERFTISFKTTFRGESHRHVVLGVSYNGRYGSLGMSRRSDLMFKPMDYKSLADLIFDFEKCYCKYWHTVNRVKVGLPIVHDQHSYEVINWKSLTLNLVKNNKAEIRKELDAHGRKIKGFSKSWTTGSYASLKTVKSVDANGASTDTNLLRRSKSQVKGTSGVKRKNSFVGTSDEYQLRI